MVWINEKIALGLSNGVEDEYCIDPEVLSTYFDNDTTGEDVIASDVKEIMSEKKPDNSWLIY